MAELALSELLSLGLLQRVQGDASVRVRGARHDSRRCEAGDLFVAVAGAASDGAQFVEDALRRGAVAVLVERADAAAALPELPVPVAVSDNALLALARIAQRLYDDPTARLSVVGITGTNGKTTCSYLIESLLKASGARPAVLGTVNFRGPFGILDATHTTPMADDMMRLARAALESGATHLVLEVSSHALAQHRADGVHFEVAAFTNLTQDHLDFHRDFAHYEAAKRRLFTDLAPRCAVLNVEDEVGRSIGHSFAGAKFRCATRSGREAPARKGDQSAEIVARSYSVDRDGIRAQIDTPRGALALHSPLIGEHNLENLLIAIGCGLALGLEIPEMERALRDANGAPGRLQRVEHPSDVLVFVDYAHTPDALERVLSILRKTTRGRLITAFGCGGDRDPGKRPLMGQASAQFADLVILTSDNPRSEAPISIIQQIEPGVSGAGLPLLAAEQLASAERGYAIESDRRAAIALALGAARAGDTVLLAGKGHEKVQIIGEQRLEFDDVVEAQRALAALAERRELARGPRQGSS
jgi:UDP-N-acetylmuramoyl-L-alanyl-D-glutamate--2,6-diaminopimelate ligase